MKEELEREKEKKRERARKVFMVMNKLYTSIRSALLHITLFICSKYEKEETKRE